MGSKFYIIFLISILGLVETNAQYLFQQHTHIDEEKGLPDNEVNAIAKDTEGFVWFGTSNGLCRFDGTNLEVFQHDELDSTSLSHNTVYDIFVDEKTGWIWIGTAEGLSIFNPATQQFKNYYSKADDPHSVSDDLVWRIYKDRQGNIWLSCWTKGLIRYNPEKDNFDRFFFNFSPEHERIAQKDDRININRANTMLDIKQDLLNDSIFWLGSLSGLLKFNPYNEKFDWYFAERENKNTQYLFNSIRHLHPHHDGNIYLGSWERAGWFDPRTNQFSDIHVTEGERSHRFARKILPKNNDEIWITYITGIVCYDILNKKVKRSLFNQPQKNLVYGAEFIDEHQRLWTGGKQGVYVYDPALQQTDIFPFEIKNYDFSYLPRKILESRNHQKIYFCVDYGDGLYEFDRTTERWHILRPSDDYFKKNKNFEGSDILYLPSGGLLVLERSGIFILPPGGDQLVAYDVNIDVEAPAFRQMMVDRRGNLWITSRRAGLFKIDFHKDTITHFKEELNYGNQSASYTWLDHIFEDQEGRIWIRLARSFCIYLPDENRFMHFPFQPGIENTFKYVKNFVEDEQGRVWMGSEKEGLGLTDPRHPENGVIQKFTTSDGLLSNNVRYLQKDSNGFIWVITDKGLSKLDPENYTFKNYASQYGIPDGHFLTMLSTGEMAIGYPKGGISIFHPYDINTNEELPQPYLSSFKVFDKQLLKNVGNSIGNHFSPQKIELRPTENFISFEFSSIAYTAPDDVYYQYQLEGVDPDWVTTFDRKNVSYANLKSGDYTFLLKAANNEHTWNEAPVKMQFSIAKPIYQETWFYGLLINSVVFLIYWLFSYRTSSIRRQERIKSDFEKQLADVELNALRAQMNPHFIFNCMNSIDYFIITDRTEEASDYLNRFSRLMRLVLQNSRSELVNLRDEMEALKLYIELESLRFENKFDYTVRIGKELNINVIEVPPLLMQPYVENAIWHGLLHKKGNGQLDLALTLKDKTLTCVIEDNGIGRHAAQKLRSKSATRQKSMGMKITNDRIDMINRKYDTNASVEVIDLYDENENATGTRVVLKIPV